ncbi:MAG TPA: RagB/SusD family nutrient uptake outer membrane protein [Bacteroidetes bacterium]|nr:RagB/SusD family nutrient uptake outer membrane protein [Bacteroidota bacterium]
MKKNKNVENMKTIKYLVMVAVLMVLAPSCSEDFLELTNPNRPDVDNFFKTEEDFWYATNAIYQTLYYDGSYMRFCQLALDLRGDDVKGDSPWDVIHNTGRFSLPNNSIMQEWLWVVFFGGVHRANHVITRIDDIEWTDQEMHDRLLGQAKFLRGLYYMHLVKFFRNIPLILEPYQSADEFYQSQADPELVWDQIYADFSDAADLLPVQWENAKDIGRATRGAALAYLGKAYLFNHRYGDAADQFEDVFDLGIYDLMENYGDNFTEEFENNQESIFEVQFDRDVGGTVLGWVDEPAANWSKTTARAITYGPENFGFSDVLPTRYLFEQFQIEQTVGGEVDPRLRETIIYDYPGCTLYGVAFRDAYPDHTKIFPKKYQNDQSGIENEFDWRSGINERLMRYADVLLMYAECMIQLDQPGVAAQYMQMVRDRVDLPDREMEFAAYTKDQLMEQLAHERFLEFALEGHRFDDIVRWGWLYDPDKLAELKVNDPEFEAYVPGREYFSIPQQEIDTNENIRQNPGY